MDKIYIKNLEFIGNHGVFAEEKFLQQKFIISIEMETCTRKAGVNDDLYHSTHYGFVSDDVERVFFSKSFDLIEALAEAIAKEILIKYSLIKNVTGMCVRKCMQVCVCVCMCMRVCARIFAWMCACMCVYMRVSGSVCAYV